MYVKVRVKTDARKESVRKVSEDHFEISVREAPEQNLANKRILALIALRYKIPLSKVRITKGHHSPSKILSVNVK